MKTEKKIFGLETEVFQYMAVVLPSIDFFIILSIALTSSHPWISTPLNLFFPLCGILTVKLVEKYNNMVFFHLFVLFTVIALTFLAFIAGPKAPVWIQVIPPVTAVLFILRSFWLRIIYTILCIVAPITALVYYGESVNDILIKLLALAAVSALLERSFSFLNKQHEKIEAQKKLIEEKNKDITDSINYAKRLQTAILPPEKYWNEQLPESFILFKPKDIVSGDFYWMETISQQSTVGSDQIAKRPTADLILFAAADCTGHGVSGAMVSVVCSNALNRTVKEFGITNPAKILDKVRELILETFARSESNIKDGMDISLCCLNSKTNELLWSGANNPLWYISENKFYEVKADKQPVGNADQLKPFTTHKLQLQKNDTLYSFTDGYADQFGGSEGKKLMRKRFKDTLIEIQNKTINEQKIHLNNFIESWKAGTEQVDDILVIGVRL